jgi:hypothetical protein
MISIQHAGSLATLPDVIRLTSTETKNEYNKTGRICVCEESEGGCAAVSQFDLSSSGSKTELH